MIEGTTLKFDEKIVYSLRSLYGKYGYAQYKMNKFEEYDLYVKNKDFLISDSVITFTDTNGRLMALKPDVTLSIIKNSKDIAGMVQKFYYNENVYRISSGTHSFREIMQTGLECIGDIDDYCICEVLLLALQSLAAIDEKALLCVSDLGLLSAILEEISLERADRDAVICCIAEKNLHELQAICEKVEMESAYAGLLQKLITLYGAPQKVLSEMRCALPSAALQARCDKLSRILSFFEGTPYMQCIEVDFSVVSNLKYYNGIVFKGFIEGIPTSVLSGGQYDSLMRQMGRKSGAIGFAVYIDMLEHFHASQKSFDEDVILLYDETEDPLRVKAAVEEIIARGRFVTAQRTRAEKVRARTIMKLQNGEVITVEDNA